VTDDGALPNLPAVAVSNSFVFNSTDTFKASLNNSAQDCGILNAFLQQVL
jgi:hypothetical protein